MLNENQLILKKYQPLRFNEFIINKKMTELFNVFINMDNLNLLLIGNPGCGKTTNIEAIIKEYYQIDKIPRENLLYINNLQDQGIQYYRTEVKNFCQIKGSIRNKKKFVIEGDEVQQKTTIDPKLMEELENMTLDNEKQSKPKTSSKKKKNKKKGKK